ncbi:MAG TPA: sugar kinase [Candidatus Eremiobacteraceae bacterium]|nr:sugar kinase [Candidatus Eremiobacteraceae bacterium]
MPAFDVTIAGEINLDLILYGLPDELPPERELLAEGMMLTLGGSSAIMAHNLSSLGSRVGFQSRIGDDELGSGALLTLQESGVDISQVRRVPGAVKTGLTVILQREAWRNMVTYSGTIAELMWDDLDLDYLANSRHFHLSSFYLQRGLRPRVPELIRKMKEAGLTTSLDTNDDPDDGWKGGLEDVLQYVDVFLPNEREVQKAAGVADVEEAVKKLAAIVPLVVVKLGRQGAIAQRGAERFACPSISVDAVDAVGAGDSFDAGFLHQYVRGADLTACLRAGNIAGAFSTTRAGGTEAFRDQKYRDQFFREH